MNQHPTYEQLNDWIDGALSADDERTVAQHCASCDECSAIGADIRALLSLSASLPRVLTPPADVWEGIEAATVRRIPSRWDLVRQLRYPLAAAAVLVIATTATLTMVVMHRNQPAPVVAGQHAPAPSDVMLAMNKAEADYGETVSVLEALLATRRNTLDTATIHLLDRHMALIDNAVRQAKKALAANPDNQQLPHMITGAYERKIDMLKRALRAPSGI